MLEYDKSLLEMQIESAKVTLHDLLEEHYDIIISEASDREKAVICLARCEGNCGPFRTGRVNNRVCEFCFSSKEKGDA